MHGMYSDVPWDLYEEEGHFTDGEQLLDDKVEQVLDSLDCLTCSQIKQCLLKHITFEPIED